MRTRRDVVVSEWIGHARRLQSRKKEQPLASPRVDELRRRAT